MPKNCQIKASRSGMRTALGSFWIKWVLLTAKKVKVLRHVHIFDVTGDIRFNGFTFLAVILGKPD